MQEESQPPSRSSVQGSIVVDDHLQGYSKGYRFLFGLSGAFGCFFLVAAPVLAVIILLQVHSISSYTSQMTGVLSFVKRNLDTPPIVGIEVHPHDRMCSKGYTQLVLARWSGTQTGCYCANATAESNYTLRPDECARSGLRYENPGTFTQLQQGRPKKNLAGSHNNVLAPARYPDDGEAATMNMVQRTPQSKCQTIWSVSARNFTSWKDNAICVKYLHQDGDVLYKKNCPKNYRLCGDYLCINQRFNCPITSLDFTAKQPHSLKENTTLIKFHNQQGYIVARSEYKEPYLLGLEVEIDGASCLSDTQYPKSKGRRYPLLKAIAKGCGPYGRDRGAYVIDRVGQESFFEENGMSAVIHDVLRGYPDYIEHSDAVLVARQRTEIKRTDFCNSLNSGRFRDANTAMQSVNEVILACYIAILVLMVSISCFMFAMQKDRGFNLAYMGKNISWVLIAGALVIVAVNGKAFSLGNSRSQDLKEASSYFTTVQKHMCFEDSQIMHAIRHFTKVPSKTVELFGFVEVSFYVALICLLFILIGPLVRVLVKPADGKAQ